MSSDSFEELVSPRRSERLKALASRAKNSLPAQPRKTESPSPGKPENRQISRCRRVLSGLCTLGINGAFLLAWITFLVRTVQRPEANFLADWGAANMDLEPSGNIAWELLVLHLLGWVGLIGLWTNTFEEMDPKIEMELVCFRTCFSAVFWYCRTKVKPHLMVAIGVSWSLDWILRLLYRTLSATGTRWRIVTWLRFSGFYLFHPLIAMLEMRTSYDCIGCFGDHSLTMNIVCYIILFMMFPFYQLLHAQMIKERSRIHTD